MDVLFFQIHLVVELCNVRYATNTSIPEANLHRQEVVEETIRPFPKTVVHGGVTTLPASRIMAHTQ